MTASPRLVFAGTPDFAACALSALLQHYPGSVSAVYTQPDRPAGRGRKLTPSAVKQIALEHDIPVLQPTDFHRQEDRQQLADLRADLMIVAAYGLLLPQSVLDLPQRGCINIHASLLPRWWGEGPIQRSLLAGDRETGISLMQMQAGLDTGPVLAHRSTAITAQDTAASLHDRLARIGAELLCEHLADCLAGRLVAIPQQERLATYAAKLHKREAPVDWQQDAASLDRQIRAFIPFPIARTCLQGIDMRLWQARPLQQSAATGHQPGTLIDCSRDGITVACGDGALLIERLQLPGRKAVSAVDFLNAHPDFVHPHGD